MKPLFDDLNRQSFIDPFEFPRSILPMRAVSTGDVNYKLYAGLPAVYILARYVIKSRCDQNYDLHKKNVFAYLADDIDPREKNFFRNLDRLQCTALNSNEECVVGYFCLKDTMNCEKFDAAYEEWYWREYDETY